MKLYKLIIPALLLSFAPLSHAQDIYKVGTASVSLEPGEDFFSLSLQGYGDPPEGRFTIGWLEKGKVEPAKSIAGIGNYLYALQPGGDIRKADIRKDVIEWEWVGATDTVFRLSGSDPNSFKIMAGVGDKLYAVSLNNRLSVYDTSQSKMNWTPLGNVDDAIALTGVKDKLYLVNSAFELREGDLQNPFIQWKTLGKVSEDIISITARNDKLYMLSSSQTIWEASLTAKETEWRKIAYLNGVTYKEPLSKIAVVDNKLYATGYGGQLYVSQNNTKGNLTASALAIKSGKSTVVIIGADLAAIDYDFGKEIKDEIFKQTGISAEAVILNMSHTHFSPTSKLWIPFGDFGYPDREYLDKIKRSIVEATKTAIESMEDARIYFARTETRIGFNRSLGKSNSSINDTDVDILKIENLKGELKSVLFLAGCHPVFPNKGEDHFTISANYPGVARKVIEENLDCTNTVFLQGCSGDINPRLDNYATLGTILAYDVLKRLEKPCDKISGGISYSLDSLIYPVNVWDKERINKFRTENLHKTGDIEAAKNVRWADLMLQKQNDGTLKSYLPVYIQTINIGNWKIIGLSREPTSEYAMAIKKIWPNRKVSVSGYNNDVSSYLPSPKHIKAGTYEGNNSFFWYGETAVFSEDIFDSVIRKIKTNNK